MPPQRRASRQDEAESQAQLLQRAARVLREVAGYEQQLDPGRGEITRRLAALVDVVGRKVHSSPREVLGAALAAATAVDRLSREGSE
jgi:hypothetical protein